MSTQTRSRFVGSRRYRIPRASRSFKNKVAMATHNPVQFTTETRDRIQWHPAQCSWFQVDLGDPTLLEKLYRTAWQNANGPDVSLTRNGAAERGMINVRFDQYSMVDLFMNATTVNCFITCHYLYPKKDIINAVDEPYIVIPTGPYGAELKDNTAGASAENPMPSDDYRYQLSMNGELVQNFRIKKRRTVKLTPGARCTFKHNLRPFIYNNRMYPTTSLTYKAKSTLFIVYKFWGDLVIYTPPDNDPPMTIRTAEGSVGMLQQTTIKAHMLSDQRKITQTSYYLDDNAGVSTTIDHPLVATDTVRGYGLPTPL